MSDKDFRVDDDVTILSRLIQHNGNWCRAVVVREMALNVSKVKTDGGVTMNCVNVDLAHGHNVKITGEEPPKRTRDVEVPREMMKFTDTANKLNVWNLVDVPEALADQLEAWIKEAHLSDKEQVANNTIDMEM